MAGHSRLQTQLTEKVCLIVVTGRDRPSNVSSHFMGNLGNFSSTFFFQIRFDSAKIAQRANDRATSYRSR
jgi:uncharacterized lipoprotein YbaY